MSFTLDNFEQTVELKIVKRGFFGGHDDEKIFGDLWIFEKGKWYKRFEHSPIKRLENGH